MNGLEHYRAGERYLAQIDNAEKTDPVLAAAYAQAASAHFLAAQVAVIAAPTATFSSDGVSTHDAVIGWDEVNQ